MEAPQKRTPRGCGAAGLTDIGEAISVTVIFQKGSLVNRGVRVTTLFTHRIV